MTFLHCGYGIRETFSGRVGIPPAQALIGTSLNLGRMHETNELSPHPFSSETFALNYRGESRYYLRPYEAFVCIEGAVALRAI